MDIVQKAIETPIKSDNFWQNIDALHLWPDNYNEGDVGKIMMSIERFGFRGALKVWQNGEVRGGNHTLLALRSLKALHKAAPRNIQQLGEYWFVPCISIADLSAAEALAFAIADNRIAAAASQNEPLLAEHLQALFELDSQLAESTGYDEGDLEGILFALNGEYQDDFKQPESSAALIRLHTCPKCGHSWSE